MAAGKVLTAMEIQAVMKGFRCAYCGRQLEERSAWKLKRDRFYCGTLCSEADERNAAFAPPIKGAGKPASR
jgi:hypothetical protein